MMMDDQESSFVFLHEEEVSQSQHEVLSHIRFGNNSLDKQFQRDIELISLAIVQSGPSEQDKIKADILLKSMLLLFFGCVCYRDISDRRFYPFNTLNPYFKNSALMHFPIAAILLHGSRALIEFPSEIAAALINWLIVDKNNWRYLATHGISALKKSEVIDKKQTFQLRKYLKEEKITGIHAAMKLLSKSISGIMDNAYFNLTPAVHWQNKRDIDEHFGIHLALGGFGNQHFVSKQNIQNDGEHGHLYINFYQGLAQQSGLLLGIEQSAPGKSDPYGGKHDLSVSDKAYSASGGDFFCKKPVLPEIYQKDYRGLTLLPFANYYDNFWNFITEDTFSVIKSTFEKCKCLLVLLTKEQSLAFIKEILTAVGGASSEDFNMLFDGSFQEIPQVKEKINTLNNEQDHVKTLQQQIIENPIKNQPFAELTILKEQLQNLSIKKNNQELTIELSHQREQTLQLQNDKQTLLFVNRIQCFMQVVINQMGCFANKSRKKNILLALQQKTQMQETNVEQLSYLLKNFINVSLMNRYYFKAETHTVKACLVSLNLPEYQSLTELLDMNYPIQYKDLFGLVSDNETKIKYFTSEKYKNNLYKFYQKEGSRKYQIDENKLNLATQQVIYQPKLIRK